MPHVPYTPAIQPRDAVMRFAEAMEKRLRENEHKGSWVGESSKELITNAIYQLGCPDEWSGSGLEIYPLDDCTPVVDAANYLMMVYDNEVSKDAI